MLRRLDPVLAIALILALVFSLYGIRWGRVECWNRDQMALRNLNGLRPSDYFKPPFHTYLNRSLVLLPIVRAEYLTKWLTGKNVNSNEAKLLGSRLLVVALFLGTIWLAYLISLRAYGQFAARVITLLFATGAGFIEYDHFLSCDSPLLFWMMLTMFFAQRITVRPEISNYLLAGFLTGICTATKYSGLAIGIIIVAAHFLSRNEKSLKALLLSRRLAFGLLMVPVGFVAGNPYAILDSQKFSADFVYYCYVTPHYEGQISGHAYGDFLRRIPEIIGWPGALLIAAAVTMSILLLIRRRDFRSPPAICFALAASVSLLYYARIGAFPHTQTRYALPVVPFLILMAGPFLQTIKGHRPYVLLLPLLVYNSVCCLSVGKRFSEDPRTEAQSWIIHHASHGYVLESSAGAPHWEKLPGLNAVELDADSLRSSKTDDADVVDLRMPRVNGRFELFSKVFESNPWVRDYARKMEDQPNEQLFTQDELRKRNPNIVTVYSSDYEVPSQIVKGYYAKMLEEKFSYDIAFDGKTTEAPRWIYPRDIDFLRGRITILTRR
jgi:Dolichyl-phosphate-mannose-protein mannosyltransferase